MTDRHAGFIVTLKNDTRDDDDAEAIVTALRMVKGVLSVKPIPADFGQHLADERARAELRDKLWNIVADTP